MNPVITAAVFSDSHGSLALMRECVRRTRPDVVIHLGDYQRDADALRLDCPDAAFYNVRGNCDIGGTAPDKDTVPLGPVTAYITHGHLYNVKYGSFDSLVYAAQEQGAKLALFGHTHVPDSMEIGGVKLVNPGAASGRAPTWARIEVFDNGGIACTIEAL